MKERLVNTASELVQPSQSAVQAFSQKRDQLSAKGNQIMGERQDLEKLLGPGNVRMAEDNNRNFARFMESMFLEYDPKVLVETVLWVFRAYRSHGFQTTYWAANLNIWVGMINQELPRETFEAIYPFYNWLIVNIPIFVKLTEENCGDCSSEGIPAH
ncbi:MAG: hypothetical protein JEZ02_05455 [Desulfatibacillum sp.]|nr:hypothetical protein [Desulfatibacillum sp.]